MAPLFKKKKKEDIFMPSNDLPIDKLSMPEGIDFSKLWEEPDQAGSITTIVSVVGAVLSFVTLLTVFFKG